MSVKTCGNCGLFNEATAFACVRCGFRFDGAPGPAQAGWVPPRPGQAPPSSGTSKSAIVAVVLVVVFVGIAFVGIVAAIAIPSLIRARAAANQSAVIGTLRSIASAEATYEAKHGRFATMDELSRSGLLREGLRNGAVLNSYVFREVNVSTYEFEFCAEATEAVTSGDDSYNITEDYVIREREGRTAPKGKTGKPIG